MHPTEDHAEADDDENGEKPRHMIGHEQIDEDDTEKSEFGADRKIDAPVMMTKPSPIEKSPKRPTRLPCWPD